MVWAQYMSSALDFVTASPCTPAHSTPARTHSLSPGYPNTHDGRGERSGPASVVDSPSKFAFDALRRKALSKSAVLVCPVDTHSIEYSRSFVRAPELYAMSVSCWRKTGKPYLSFLGIRLHVSTLWALFRDLDTQSVIVRLNHKRRLQPTLRRSSFSACTFVCVFRFCLSADGNASGWLFVTISMFS